MGQYHLTINLDKKEFINPHRLGSGLKLWEQLANEHGPGKALVVLLAHPDQRGGGDLDVDQNWHGPERVDMSKVGETPEEYQAIARRTIGRWRGDRLAIIGDYAEDGDLPNYNGEIPVSQLYGRCRESGEDGEGEGFTDVTDDECAVIEHELNGRFVGHGWRHFVTEGQVVFRWKGKSPDLTRVEGTVTKVNAKLIEVKWPTGPKKYCGANPKVDFF